MDSILAPQETEEASHELLATDSPGSTAAAVPIVEGPHATDDEDAGLTLLDRLDRRQNRVLSALDQLNLDIERLVTQCQLERQRAQAA